MENKHTHFLDPDIYWGTELRFFDGNSFRGFVNLNTDPVDDQDNSVHDLNGNGLFFLVYPIDYKMLEQTEYIENLKNIGLKEFKIPIEALKENFKPESLRTFILKENEELFKGDSVIKDLQFIAFDSKTNLINWFSYVE